MSARAESSLSFSLGLCVCVHAAHTCSWISVWVWGCAGFIFCTLTASKKQMQTNLISTDGCNVANTVHLLNQHKNRPSLTASMCTCV